MTSLTRKLRDKLTADRTQRPLSQHPEIKKRLDYIEKNWISVGQARELPRRLIKNINTFGSMAINRDDRGVNQRTITITNTTLRHIKSALRSLTKQDHSKREARRLLIQLQHHTNFEVTANAAREFAGRVQIYGKRENSRRAVCDQEIHEIMSPDCPTTTLRRVVSEAELLSVGRTLELCVGHKESRTRSYFNVLRNLETEYWSLKADDSTFALLAVSCVDGARRLGGFEGHAGGNPSEFYESLIGIPLDPTVLQQVARKLELKELEHETFSEAGVFDSLLIRENESKYEDFEDADANYRVWLLPDELIIKKKSKMSSDAESRREIQWSRFCRSEETRHWYDESSHYRSMSINELMTVVVKFPKLTQWMRKQMN